MYAKALSKFANTKCKSGIINETASYYSAKLETWNVIRKEMFHKSRQHYKFVSFSKKQSAIAHYSNLFIKKAKKRAEKEKKKIILFFGDGFFERKRSKKSHARVARSWYI